ncbi:MAG TPA: hypothetical protein VE641_05490, partial [Chthoniobacterales bacterium]|nr:hypothetical protein [Chthoniobacterales bacterium]
RDFEQSGDIALRDIVANETSRRSDCWELTADAWKDNATPRQFLKRDLPKILERLYPNQKRRSGGRRPKKSAISEKGNGQDAVVSLARPGS